MTAGYYISFEISTQILIKHFTHRQVVGEPLDVWGTRQGAANPLCPSFFAIAQN